MSEPPNRNQDIPTGMAVFVPGLRFPDFEVRDELGIGHLRSFVEYVDPGPDGNAGWLMTRDPQHSGQFDWLRLGPIFVGARCQVPAEPVKPIPAPRPARKRKKPSKAIADLIDQIEREVRAEITQHLQQGA